MSQIGEDRPAEGVEEALESGRADEILSKFADDPTPLSVDETQRSIRIAEGFCFKVTLLAPTS